MPDTDKKSSTIGFKARGSSASWMLRATQPDGSASEIFIVDGMTIGRTSANSIQAYDDGSGAVERSHARVEFQGDGSVLLKCLHVGAGVETGGTTSPSMLLEVGSTFRIGRTDFEVVANPSAEQVSIAATGRGCPYCGHPDIAGMATLCSACGQPVVVVPAEQNLGVPTFLPGRFRDAEGREYPVERFVARGGMGYVLKAKAEQNTPVALKVLIFDSNTNSQAVSRFQQEIDLLRKLHDPNVLRLISHGQEAGLFFFVMEWVDGHDLRSELPSPGKPGMQVDFSKALRWFEQACEGLSAIHRAGAVHRDIKPSNLLLRNDGQLLIADLGVAKRLDDGETGMTRTGQLPGTYWYMAPEQHYAPDLVDQRTDIYSLGLTFWELLTGFRPSGVDPQPPSKVNPTVPKEFDEILRTMLASRIDDRPTTMLEVLRSLPKPIGQPPAQVRHEPVPDASPTVAGPTSTVTGASRIPVSAEQDRTGVEPHVPTPDLIAKGLAQVEVTLRECDAIVRRGAAYLWPRVLQLITFVARQGAYVRKWLTSAVAATPPASGSEPPASETPGGVLSAPGRDATFASVASPSAASGSPATATTSPSSGIAAQEQAWEGRRDTFGESLPPSVSMDTAAQKQASALEAEVARARMEIEAKLQEAIAFPEDSNERLDALKAARRALTLVPAALRTTAFDSEIRPAIEGHLRVALRSRGDEAFADKRFGLALVHYQELRQLALADDLISDRIDHIRALRKFALEQAAATLRRGHLGQAKEQLIQLRTDLVGDPEFIPECEQLLFKTKLIEQRVKETIPALRATKSLFRMSKMLEELAAEKVVVGGLDELLEKTHKALTDGSRRLALARRFLEEGNVDLARKAIAEVRDAISDHPEADELSGRVDVEVARQNQLVQDVTSLVDNGKLLRAHQVLRVETPQRLAKLGLVNQFKEAATYKRRSDRFVRLIAWAVGGSVCVGVAALLTDLLWAGLTSVATGLAPLLTDTVSGRCLSFACFALAAYLGLYGLRELLGRSHKTRFIVPDIVVLLVTVGVACAADIGLKILTEKVSANGTRAGLDFVRNGGYWFLGACTAAVLSSVIASLSRLGIDVVVPQATVSLRPAIFFGIVLAIVGAFASLSLLGPPPYRGFETEASLVGIVPSTILAVAVASLLASVRPRRLVGWASVAAIAGMFLPRWASVQQFSNLTWGVVVWEATLACGIFLGMERRSRGNAFLAAGISCVAIVATSVLLGLDGYQNAFSRLLPWAAACIIVPGLAQKNIVQRLDVMDRLRDFFRWSPSPAAHSQVARRTGGRSPAAIAKEILSKSDYSNYRNVRAVSFLFVFMGSVLVLGGSIATIAMDKSNPQTQANIAVAVGIAFAGLAGAVGGAAALGGSRQWAPSVYVMAAVYVFAFPLGTILSLVLVAGLSRYLNSAERIRAATLEAETGALAADRGK